MYLCIGVFRSTLELTILSLHTEIKSNEMLHYMRSSREMLSK